MISSKRFCEWDSFLADLRVFFVGCFQFAVIQETKARLIWGFTS